MNRDVEGVGGQVVTTWGSDVVAGVIIPRTERALTTHLSCRCGKVVKYKGFPSYRANRKVGFIAPLPGKVSEWFCGLPCVISFEKDAYQAMLLASYTQHMSTLNTVLDGLLSLKEPR